MSWLHSYDVAVSSVRTSSNGHHHALFQVTLVPRDASVSRITIDQPLAAFHSLRQTLLQTTTSRRTPQWMRRVIKTNRASSGCQCEAQATCPFQSIHEAVRGFGSLPAPSSTLFRSRGDCNKADYRVVLECWLQCVHKTITNYSSVVLQTKYQRGDCSVLNAYTSFVNATAHFPVVSAITLHQPLALRAWRAERVQANDEQNVNLVDEEEEHRMTDQVDSDRRLPRLDVKRVGLATLQTFLEDFRETILTQHGQDIKELQSPDLTMARRWEIALYIACRIGHSYGVQLILFYYADADVTMADGTSCLHIASRMGRTEIVQLLIDEGADVNAANNTGITPLIAACRNGCGEVIKLLLAAGANVSVASAKGTQAIHAAIVSHNVKLVQLLLKRGADVRAMTESGLTPLHFAAKLGSLEMTELLLKHHADPEQQTKNGSDAISIASTNGHMELCELFQKEMDRKNVLSSSGGKLFHRFKKSAKDSRTSLPALATITSSARTC